MAKEAHTPGPWELDERRRSAYIPYRGKHHSAAAYGGTVANARLIAAAPETYDFLLWCVETYGGLASSPVANKARALLAKIEGGAK